VGLRDPAENFVNIFTFHCSIRHLVYFGVVA
jgi:hypothetical protein